MWLVIVVGCGRACGGCGWTCEREREDEICGVDDFVLIFFGFMFKICGAVECVVRNCLYFG